MLIIIAHILIGPYLGWIYTVLVCVNDEKLLHMIGLDGFMLLRFISVCFKSACFLTVLGCVTLLPIYATAGGSAEAWDTYTVSNVPDKEAGQYWGIVVYAYIVAAFFCHLMYKEYENFFKKRLDFLVRGDDETPRQTAYTIMIENVPPEIRSSTALANFMEDIYPGKVYSCVLAKDLHVLDKVVRSRLKVVTELEKADAFFKATGRSPTKIISTIFGGDVKADFVINDDMICSRKKIDAIEYYRNALEVHNAVVKEMQGDYGNDSICTPSLNRISQEISLHELNIVNGDATISRISSCQSSTMHDNCKNEDDMLQNGLKHVIGVGKAPVVGVAYGIKEIANKLQLITPGLGKIIIRSDNESAFQQNNSSTGFITMTSLECASVLHQVILSHSEGYDGMLVKPAPNPHDILWFNVHVPFSKYEIRHNIADLLIFLGVIFWAAIVAGITTISNLDNVANNWKWLSENRSKTWYQVLNDYVPFILILALMAILPLVFDMTARYYERLKCESEIQKSIMNRYFYFQLANVYVAIAAGSVSYGIDEIISKPYNIINILGNTLPSVSLYFASLLIVWTFVQLPFELIGWRIFYFGPSIIGCYNKKMMTRREWRMGIVSDFPILYGWIYPNQVFVMMIMMAYSCIAPLLVPFCLIFYGFSYMMYKYQLLYIWVNRYQSGGALWYEVFNKSMISMIGGIVILLSYLALKKTVLTGPFYFLLLLPFMVIYFWRRCENKFKNHSQSLSIHRSVKLDRVLGTPKCGGSLSHGHLVHRAGLTGDASFFTNDSLDSIKTADRASNIESQSSSNSDTDRELLSWKDGSGLFFYPDLYQQRSLFVGKMEPEDYRRETAFILEEKVKSPFAREERTQSDDTLMENELGEKLLETSTAFKVHTFGNDINSNHANDKRECNNPNEIIDKEHLEDMVDEILLGHF